MSALGISVHCFSGMHIEIFLFFNIYFKDFIYLFLDRGEGRETERERNVSVWLPLTHPTLGNLAATQACVPNGN